MTNGSSSLPGEPEAGGSGSRSPRNRLQPQIGNELEVRPEVPDKLADAILEAANILAAALPPGFKLSLDLEDQADLLYSEEELQRSITSGSMDGVKARMLPGRLEVGLTIYGRSGVFYPTDGEIEHAVTAYGRLGDRDGDGRFDDIHLISYDVVWSRPWPPW